MNIKAKLLIFGALAALSLVAAQSVKAESFLTVGESGQMDGRNVASPADDITFFSFSLTNSENSDEDIILNRLVINNFGTSGEQVRSALSSLTLYSQVGNVVARTSTRSGRNGYSFTNFNRELGEGVVPNDGITYHYRVAATVNHNIAEGLTIKLGINSVNSLRATGADSNTRTQVSGEFPYQGNEFTITADGDNGLGTISAQAEANPASTNVVAGSANVPVLNISFLGTFMTNRITSLRFAQIIEGTTRSVESLTIVYRNEAGENVTATRNFTAGRNYVTFSLSNNPIYVSNNQRSLVSVYANLAAINQNFGAYTGDQLKFSFIANQGFSARNYNNRLIRSAVAEGNQVDGNIMVVHGTMPTIKADAAQGNLANGPVDLYRFKVTAAEGTDLTLKKLSFKLALNDSVTIPQNATATTLMLRNFEILEGNSYNGVFALTQADMGADSYQIYNGYGVTTSIATGYSRWPQGGKLSNAIGTIVAFYPANAGGRNVILVFNDDRLIRSGESKYYILRATAINVDTGANSNDSISVYMQDGDTTMTNSKFLTTSCDVYDANCRMSKYGLSADGIDIRGRQNDTGAYFIWSDNTGANGNMQHVDRSGGDGGSSADWFNGWKIKTLSVQRTLN